MKKYIILVLVLFFSVQAFAQKESLEERYKIPKEQIIKLYKHSRAEGKSLYFFNPVGFDRVSLEYFRHLMFKDIRITSIKANTRTSIITIEITKDLNINDLRTQVITAKEEVDYLLENYDNHIAEIEKIIYESGN